jgi:hypothetical protein
MGEAGPMQSPERFHQFGPEMRSLFRTEIENRAEIAVEADLKGSLAEQPARVRANAEFLWRDRLAMRRRNPAHREETAARQQALAIPIQHPSKLELAWQARLELLGTARELECAGPLEQLGSRPLVKQLLFLYVPKPILATDTFAVEH